MAGNLWTEEEITFLKATYPHRGGNKKCRKHLNRTTKAIEQKAFAIGCVMWTKNRQGGGSMPKQSAPSPTTPWHVSDMVVRDAKGNQVWPEKLPDEWVKPAKRDPILIAADILPWALSIGLLIFLFIGRAS